MVGDSVGSDVKRAPDARLNAILYAPMAEESHRALCESKAPVIRHTRQLLAILESLGYTKLYSLAATD